jgi:hypothetical protein
MDQLNHLYCRARIIECLFGHPARGRGVRDRPPCGELLGRPFEGAIATVRTTDERPARRPSTGPGRRPGRRSDAPADGHRDVTAHYRARPTPLADKEDGRGVGHTDQQRGELSRLHRQGASPKAGLTGLPARPSDTVSRAGAPCTPSGGRGARPAAAPRAPRLMEPTRQGRFEVAAPGQRFACAGAQFSGTRIVPDTSATRPRPPRARPAAARRGPKTEGRRSCRAAAAARGARRPTP